VTVKIFDFGKSMSRELDFPKSNFLSQRKPCSNQSAKINFSKVWKFGKVLSTGKNRRIGIRRTQKEKPEKNGLFIQPLLIS